MLLLEGLDVALGPIVPFLEMKLTESLALTDCALPCGDLRDRAYDDIDEEDPFNPQARHMTFNPSRASHVHSFCSYSSSLDSQASPHPPPQTAAILPTSEYM